MWLVFGYGFASLVGGPSQRIGQFNDVLAHEATAYFSSTRKTFRADRLRNCVPKCFVFDYWLLDKASRSTRNLDPCRTRFLPFEIEAIRHLLLDSEALMSLVNNFRSYEC